MDDLHNTVIYNGLIFAPGRFQLLFYLATNRVPNSTSKLRDLEVRVQLVNINGNKLRHWKNKVSAN